MLQSSLSAHVADADAHHDDPQAQIAALQAQVDANTAAIAAIENSFGELVERVSVLEQTYIPVYTTLADFPTDGLFSPLIFFQPPGGIYDVISGKLVARQWLMVFDGVSDNVEEYFTNEDGLAYSFPAGWYPAASGVGEVEGVRGVASFYSMIDVHNAQSRGLPTWTMLDEAMHEAVIAMLPPEKQDLTCINRNYQFPGLPTKGFAMSANSEIATVTTTGEIAEVGVAEVGPLELGAAGTEHREEVVAGVLGYLGHVIEDFELRDVLWQLGVGKVGPRELVREQARHIGKLCV